MTLYNMDKTIKTKIIAGYKGIIDLDLTYVDSKYHDILIKQHLQDIDRYKSYQNSLEDEMKYENTIEKIMAKKKIYDAIRDRKIEEKEFEETQRLENLLTIHYGPKR